MPAADDLRRVLRRAAWRPRVGLRGLWAWLRTAWREEYAAAAPESAHGRWSSARWAAWSPCGVLGADHAKGRGQWEPASRRWLIAPADRPVLRTLRRTTDPLFRQAGIGLDEGADVLHEPDAGMAVLAEAVGRPAK